MPFTCASCGGRTDLIPAVDGLLRCPHCAIELPFVRSPLLVVVGPAGVGKSTICARLAGEIPAAVLVDADILSEDRISVAAAEPDPTAFWRANLRLAHELAQNRLTVVYFSVMLPEQVLANEEALEFFEAVHFLCLLAPQDVLRARIGRQAGSLAGEPSVEAYLDQRIANWNDFNARLAEAARTTPRTTVVDATRPLEEVVDDVRTWILDRVADPPPSHEPPRW